MRGAALAELWTRRVELAAARRKTDCIVDLWRAIMREMVKWSWDNRACWGSVGWGYVVVGRRVKRHGWGALCRLDRPFFS